MSAQPRLPQSSKRLSLPPWLHRPVSGDFCSWSCWGSGCREARCAKRLPASPTFKLHVERSLQPGLHVPATPAPSPETPTASSNCLRPHCLCMLGSAGGFLASPVPRAAETLPAIVCPAAAHLGPAETAVTAPSGLVRLCIRDRPPAVAPRQRPPSLQLCAVASRRRIPLCAASAQCPGAAWETLSAPGGGPRTLPCAITWMTTAQDSCPALFLKNTSMLTVSTFALCAGFWSSVSTTGPTLAVGLSSVLKPLVRASNPAAAADPGLPTFADGLATKVATRFDMSLRLPVLPGPSALPEHLPLPCLATLLPRGWSCSCSPKPCSPLRSVAEPATAHNLVRPPGAGACAGLTVSGWSYGRTVCLSRAAAGQLAFRLKPATPVAAAWQLRGSSRVPATRCSASTLAALQAKHPHSPLPDLASLGVSRPGAVPEFSAEAVVQAVRSFKRASAPGPSGLRADHLRESLCTAHTDEVATHLAALCHLLARGEAPATLAPHLAGATLHALTSRRRQAYSCRRGSSQIGREAFVCQRPSGRP